MHRPWPGLKPRTSDPVASTITTGPLGSTRVLENKVLRYLGLRETKLQDETVTLGKRFFGVLFVDIGMTERSRFRRHSDRLDRPLMDSKAGFGM